MAYPAYPRRVTRAHRKAMIDLVGEDSIVHGREVGLFELITTLWCRSASHRHFCIPKIELPISVFFLIPLVKSLVLAI